MNLSISAIATVLCAVFALVAFAKDEGIKQSSTIITGPDGMGRVVIDGYRELPVQIGVMIFRDDWTANDGQWTVQDRQFKRVGDTLTMTGHLDVAGTRVNLTQTTINTPDGTTIDYELVAAAAIENASSVSLSIDLEPALFADWTFRLDDQTPVTRPASFDKTQLATKPDTRRAIATSPDGERSLEFIFGPAASVQVQDGRAWKAEQLNIMATFHAGAMRANEPVKFSYRARVKIAADTAPAKITIDAAKTLNTFDGTGGNFVYAIEDPATQLNLKTLRLTWARVGAMLGDWAPTPDSIAGANDKPGSPLRKRFELDRQLMKLSDGRLILSVWRLPEWMYEQPIDEKVWRENPGTVARANWPKLAEVIGSYLSHLKSEYGVEPALFSFNENDMGIYVKLTSEEHRDMMKLLGAEFEKRGLKTRQLAGDSAMLKDGIVQIQATLNDADAMRYVGALGYHPWAGEKDLWDDWADAAKKAALPLLTTEMGSDAGGYRDQSYNQPRPTFALARKYVEQIAHARTQGLMEWEWTGDYGTYDKVDGKPVASRRHAVLWHFANLTPQFADVLSTVSSRQDTPAASLKKGDEFVLHVANPHEARSLEIAGVPTGVVQLHVVVTTLNQSAVDQGVVKVENGKVTFEAPAQSLVTFVSKTPAIYKTGLE